MKPDWRCCLCHTNDFERSRKRDLCEVCFDGLAPRGLAWCSKCKRRVQIEQTRSDSRRTWCIACWRVLRQRRNPEHQRAWYARNRDKAAAYNRRPDVLERRRERRYAKYWQNAEKERAASRARYKPGSRNEYARQWRAAHPDYARANSQQRRARQKLRILQSWKRAA
jgi:hypothetical protein